MTISHIISRYMETQYFIYSPMHKHFKISQIPITFGAGGLEFVSKNKSSLLPRIRKAFFAIKNCYKKQTYGNPGLQIKSIKFYLKFKFILTSQGVNLGKYSSVVPKCSNGMNLQIFTPFFLC